MGSCLVAWGLHVHASDGAQQAARDCEPLLAAMQTQRALQMASVLIQSQGMRLVVQDCPYLRVAQGQMAQVIGVRVQVIDAETASRFVQGPLAEGEEVDMGEVSVLGQAPEEDPSPDVLHNRRWLAGVMQRHGWAAVPGYWWAFVPVSAERSVEMRK